MRRLVLVGLALASACAPVTPSVASPTAGVSGNAAATATATATATDTPTAPPSARPPASAPASDPLSFEVKVSQAPFGIVTSLMLKPAPIDAELARAASGAVTQYLHAIDMYRDGSSPALPISGPFLDAVSVALKESATPGVKRQFQLASLSVDRHLLKPWGTHAYIDVTVTIVDRAVDGSAPDQWETGKLRLMGDRFRVTDGWDAEHDRWFNGFAPLQLAFVRDQIPPAVAMYVRMESWTPTSAPLDWRTGADALPFLRARAEKLNAIDRTVVASRFFEGTTATIERFDTIEGLWTGLATVRVNGTLVTVGADGQSRRVAFERRMKVFLFGSWMPEVVDEEISPGVWLSGGDLALAQVDVDRA
jgi:hypothetical protein